MKGLIPLFSQEKIIARLAMYSSDEQIPNLLFGKLRGYWGLFRKEKKAKGAV